MIDRMLAARDTLCRGAPRIRDDNVLPKKKKYKRRYAIVANWGYCLLVSDYM